MNRPDFREIVEQEVGMKVPPSEYEQWEALAEADTLHMLPVEALVASIKYLAEKLLDVTCPLDDPEFDEIFKNVRIKFWDCPENHPRLPQRVRIRWDGDLATCLDCGRTNQDTEQSMT